MEEAMDLWKQHQASEWSAFDRYEVKILLRDIVGGKPATPEMIAKWVEATCKAAKAEARAKIVDAHVETLPETVEEEGEKQGIVFSRVDGELAIEGRQIKAMLKEAGNICKDIVPTGRMEKRTAAEIKAGKDPKPQIGITALRSKVADQVFVEEEHVGLGRTEADEVNERAIHVMTARGPRNSIKRSEICRDVEITFHVRRRTGSGEGVPEPALLAILDYAQTVGLGADRSQGFGQFTIQSVVKL
jgi:hypothetical protein